MAFEQIFLGFLIALAAGALIGLERQQDKTADQRPGLGGVRTFPLIALAGALSALISHTVGAWVIVSTLLVVGSVLSIAYFRDWKQHTSRGMTTPVAALITFLLGVLALLPRLPLDTVHRYLLIIGSAAVVMALLSFKEHLHQAVRHISDDDIYATAKFVILALVVLPLLPNRTVGPLHVLNPFNIGIMVALIAGLSFLGYVSSRMVGAQKGLATTGILGGLISSTAVTVSMAHQVKRSPELVVSGAMAILAASSTMFTRMLVIVGIVNSHLVFPLLAPLGTMTLAGYGAVLALYLKTPRSSSEKTSVTHRNPFELRPALTFGLFYSVVLLVTKAAQTYLGQGGLYASSVLAGTTDVDAITLSLLQFHSEGLDAAVAVTAMTLAAITNTIVKTLLAWGLGGWRLGQYVAMGMMAILVGGCAVIVFMP